MAKCGNKEKGIEGCGQEIKWAKDPTTGRNQMLNLDGTEHWRVCPVKQAKYQQKKQEASSMFPSTTYTTEQAPATPGIVIPLTPEKQPQEDKTQFILNKLAVIEVQLGTLVQSMNENTTPDTSNLEYKIDELKQDIQTRHVEVMKALDLATLTAATTGNNTTDRNFSMTTSDNNQSSEGFPE